jgi:GTP-binding protein
MAKPLPSVVLVGRPNVGKSTLFNRLVESRRSIVTAVPGTTRDVIEQEVEWLGNRFRLVDTGGMFGFSRDPLYQLVLERGRRAVAEADLLVLVVDGREGLVAGDQDVATAVRQADAPALLVINKTDDKRAQAGALELYRLGFDPVLEVSAEHGLGVGDLLDALVAALPVAAGYRARAAGLDEGGEGPPEVAVAVIGRPNAGKSSLVNRLLREERMIVSETPGTTRDSVDTLLAWHRRKFRIVDTAGIRRPGRVARAGQVESVSVLLAKRVIQAVDVVVLVLDATAGITEQDAAIAGEADRAGRGIIIAANKWDLMKGEGRLPAAEFDEDLRSRLKFLDYAPILHLSAVTGERTPKLLEAIDRVAVARTQRVKTSELNTFIAAVTTSHPPPAVGGRRVRILYAAQTGVEPPTFVLFTNIATAVHFSYERFLVNRIRESFGFAGSPVRLRVRRKQSRRSGRDEPTR